MGYLYVTCPCLICSLRLLGRLVLSAFLNADMSDTEELFELQNIIITSKYNHRKKKLSTQLLLHT
jgi:hypothetical protein